MTEQTPPLSDREIFDAVVTSAYASTRQAIASGWPVPGIGGRGTPGLEVVFEINPESEAAALREIRDSTPSQWRPVVDTPFAEPGRIFGIPYEITTRVPVGQAVLVVRIGAR